MTKVLKVTRDQVKAGRTEVIAMRAAGCEPEPMVMTIAKTPLSENGAEPRTVVGPPVDA